MGVHINHLTWGCAISRVGLNAFSLPPAHRQVTLAQEKAKMAHKDEPRGHRMEVPDQLGMIDHTDSSSYEATKQKMETHPMTDFMKVVQALTICSSTDWTPPAPAVQTLQTCSMRATKMASTRPVKARMGEDGAMRGHFGW